jgi:hypothetical protein
MITNEPMFTVADHSLREARACHAYIDARQAAKDVPSVVQHSTKISSRIVRDRKGRKKNVHQRSYCVISNAAVLIEGDQCTGRPTAPVITRYRCFLPDLAGLAGLRRVGPGTGTILPLHTILRSPAQLQVVSTGLASALDAAFHHSNGSGLAHLDDLKSLWGCWRRESMAGMNDHDRKAAIRNTVLYLIAFVFAVVVLVTRKNVLGFIISGVFVLWTIGGLTENTRAIRHGFRNLD